MKKIDSLNDFLHDFMRLVEATGIDVSNYNLDHVAYQAASSEEYDDIREEFLEISNSEHEAMVGGRRVGVFTLKEPIRYDNNIIVALEILEPKEGREVVAGWEHAEFVIDETYDNFMERYPEIKWDVSSIDRPIYTHLKIRFPNGMQLKFHNMDILETIKLDEEANE